MRSSLFWTLSSEQVWRYECHSSTMSACTQTQEHRGMYSSEHTHTHTPRHTKLILHLHIYTSANQLTCSSTHTHTNRRMEKLEDIPHLLSLEGLPEFALA